MESLRAVSDWPVETVATAVIDAEGRVLDTFGPVDQRFPLASVTKPLTAYAVLVAVEEGAVEWDQPAGPEGATLRHLIAHASGLAFDSADVQAAPGTKRIYSNTGFEVMADLVATATDIPFADYLAEAVFSPLGMSSSGLAGSPAAGVTSTVADLARFAAEVQSPKLVSAASVAEATTVAFPGLRGVLPGYGLQRHNDWGLGFEIKADKSPHWTGASSSARTFGHFGQAGTFLWFDPEAGAACVALTDRRFGEWAIEAWPAFTDGVLAELR
ncbi:CubicO group peptidase (beta-lactamase class C family) [Saccharothrix tamanrassetensis]|uniref:CubicO group peptidase (Beta-lactamase class C family) n=1 Tax=Saccharothrix tamanrassetensis TaxID=1051531 RepID=A0A841CPR4_9PSEU|nr:serine hydrolase domain-containing protein [Saccharothrix tamanrassetensis]MBB5958903.1 CubicO group peptidase (beta-lactamase class C family) [Saccharothrix tamanrassetensis]